MLYAGQGASLTENYACVCLPVHITLVKMVPFIVLFLSPRYSSFSLELFTE